MIRFGSLLEPLLATLVRVPRVDINMPSIDCKFPHSGYIDVLLPPCPCQVCSVHTGSDNSARTSCRNRCKFQAPESTASYEIGHYDKQRPVEIKVPCACADQAQESRVEETVRSAVETLAWRSFAFYLHTCRPVKISDFVAFNRDSCPSSSWGAFSDARNLREIVNRFPEDALRATITVQCNLNPLSHSSDRVDGGASQFGNDSCERYQQEEKKRRRLLLKDIDDVLTVACHDAADDSNDGDKCVAKNCLPPVFYGQEDQVSVELSLDDVLRQKFDLSQVRLYVAQETVLSSSQDAGKLYRRIICKPDGTLSMTSSENSSQERKHCSISSKGQHETLTPLQSLGPGIVCPSLLLPPEHVQINEVNFWFSPQNSRTNYHYDSSHNILEVIHGAKTVELAPPGSIKGSPIYSEHANHPAVLCPSYQSTSTKNLNCEIHATKASLNLTTMVVSITAGDALFIPAGWWHRVESCGPCLAVNFWFSQLEKDNGVVGPNVQSANKHMLPFQARQLLRQYFQEHFDEWAKKYIRLYLEKKLTERANDHDFKSCFGHINYDAMDISETAARLERTITKLVQESKPYPDLVSQITYYLTVFLCYVKIDEEHHRTAVLRLFNGVYPWRSSLFTNSTLLASVILQLERTACYVITRIWEKQIELGCEKQKEAEESYAQLFAKCGDLEMSVRSHLQQQVEKFRSLGARHILVNELIFGVTEDLFL